MDLKNYVLIRKVKGCNIGKGFVQFVSHIAKDPNYKIVVEGSYYKVYKLK